MKESLTSDSAVRTLREVYESAQLRSLRPDAVSYTHLDVYKRQGCELWRQLGLQEFWDARLAGSREEVAWEKVLQLLVVNRLLDPGSEFRVHRQWYLSTAMDALLGTDFAVAEKDRLYRCLDRVLEHKQELFLWLHQKWADLFHADFEVCLLYTSRCV